MSNDIKNSFKEVVNEGKDKLKDTAHNAKENFHDFREKANDHIGEVKKKADDFASIAEDEFKRLYGEDNKLEMISNFIKDRPLLSMGLALGGGMIMAKMLRCCRRK